MQHPTRLSSEARRAAIIEAAIQLFSEKGFRGTTTRELAATVGVSEPVLYQHFATKSELYAAIIDNKSQVGAERFTAQLAGYAEAEDDAGYFTALAQAILRWYETDPAYIRLLLFSSLERHEFAELFTQRRACGFYGLVTGYIRSRIEQGAYRNVDPALAAEAFIGMVAHHGLFGIIFGCAKGPLDSSAVVEGMVSLFLKGLVQ